MKKIFVCAREKERMNLEGYEDYVLIETTERIQLNPKYLSRLRYYLDTTCPDGFILISRSPFITSILEAGNFVYEILYS